MDIIEDMTEEDARVLWTHGGFGTPDDFPGTRVAVLRMLRPGTASALRSLGQHFAALAPRAGVVALAALLRALAPRPTGIALPAPAPVRLSPQRRCHRLTPARAP